MPQPLTRNDVLLESGRVIHLRSIEQWGTYSGLLEGIPTQEMNHRIIKRTMDAAREKYHFEPYLISPVEALIDGFPGYRFGTPAEIPSITCVATFECYSIARDESMDLMLKMGYGGPGDDAGTVTSYGHDGGIDGVINEDTLGLDVIYLQAKRWDNTVGRPEIRGCASWKTCKEGRFSYNQ